MDSTEITKNKMKKTHFRGGITSPKGFKAGGTHAGIKKAKKDLSIIYSETPAVCSAVFTKNIVKAPPLVLCQETLAKNDKISAIIINSGNANACTGARGYKDAVDTANALGKELNIDSDRILVTSTGVIGQFLPMDKVLSGIKELAPKLASDEASAQDCAEGIMTTDTFVKVVTVEIDLDGVSVKVSGIAKGSGMIMPNMATMLAFLTTDAAITKDMLDKSFKSVIADSFNMISVDGETSTNDMAVILANGTADNKTISYPSTDFEKFKEAVGYVCTELAKMIIKDGEGATKFLEVKLSGAKSDEDARMMCKAVINSSLVKTAFFGEDANWGRILSAMGASGAVFDPETAKISFESAAGKILLYEKGLPVNFDEAFASKILKEKEIKIIIELSDGTAATTGWGCDLSYDYVKINADYRT